MLTAEGCRQRRDQFVDRLGPHFPSGPLVLTNPIHLMYLANFFVDPISLGAGFGGALLLDKDGHTKLIYENHLPKIVQEAHVDERQVVPWYNGQSPALCPREMAWTKAFAAADTPRPHDQPGDALAPRIADVLADLRRKKGDDELALIRQSITAGEAGHAWARENVKPGITEIDVYRGVNSVCIETAGHPVIVYGDFAVSTGPERKGGPPTERVLQPGDMFILDYSVVIGGYRGDFTNTLVVGGKPTTDQMRLFSLCAEAMAAGESTLRAGIPCVKVYDAVNGLFENAAMAEHFPHHAGHGLGLTHPEAPYLVRHATETLEAGDVVTLEPGLYVNGIGGLRIENNYLITATGYERLTHHIISLS